MQLGDLLAAVRQAVSERAWGEAVRLAREGAVVGVSNDGEEVRLRVKSRRRAQPCEVYLWPDDPDWGCDCELSGKACVHVAAAAIALQRSQTREGGRLPEPRTKYQVTIRYDFTTRGQALELERYIVWADGRVELLTQALAESDLMASRADVQAESLLALHTGGALTAELLRRLLVILEGRADATLDGEPVQTSPEPVLFEVKVTDEGDGFQVGLYRPSGIDKLFRGAALAGGVLRPTSHGELTPNQRKLLVRGVHFEKHEVGGLVGDYLPRLRERIPVTILSERVPQEAQLVPQVEVHLSEAVAGLEVRTGIAYGDPPVARVRDGKFEILGEVVPARDLSAERRVARDFERQMGLTVGFKHVLSPERAAEFLRDRLPRWKGAVRGGVSVDRFQVSRAPLAPRMEITQAEGGSWSLDVHFEGEAGEADPDAVLRAWRGGRSLVPLMDGGYAPLPAAWLDEHGPLLRELFEARDAEGRIGRHATAALVELLEQEEEQRVPSDLRKLRAFLEGEDGLPDVALPDGFNAELRPYQTVGYHWLQFLRSVELNGVLADDMGLGKTIQALAAMSDAGGQHLVVAPTSVIRNWAREAERFTPNQRVNIYHGPGRKLDDSEITLTSYAILRLDLEALRAREWTYVVLDEAQAIKNPSSQTARAANKLRSRHRLALTGTPVENRLEELWSLFRFLMPGFLGSLEAFRDRFSRPIEAGDASAREALRRRVRPYIMRRLKKQVATELPALTDIVIRCEMGKKQRSLYDAVRNAAREDVQKALEQRGMRGSTMQVLEALLRMRQVCCDPALLPGVVDDGIGAAKLDRLEDLLVEIVVEDHKALIFSQWTTLLDRVEARLRKLDIPWVRLDGSTRNRQEVIDAFQSDDGPPVFLLSLKAGGTGLNLTAADYVVHLDPWWNPAVQQQATDRAHRIGQDKPVVSCRLIAEGTVEERILELQDVKRDLAEAALGTEGGFLRALTADELRDLFAD